jgi:transcriptional antiterminator NusG
MLGKVDELSTESESVSIPFEYGENIKVIDGPFNGFNGVIEKVNQEKRKLEVMVKIFGRKTPLELSYMQVEKI